MPANGIVQHVFITKSSAKGGASEGRSRAIEFIPDFIPVLGIVDDLIIVSALIAFSLKLIPQKVLEDARVLLKKQSRLVRKKDWFFALIIVCIWTVLLFFLYKFIRHLFQ